MYNFRLMLDAEDGEQLNWNKLRSSERRAKSRTHREIAICEALVKIDNTKSPKIHFESPIRSNKHPFLSLPQLGITPHLNANGTTLRSEDFQGVAGSMVAPPPPSIKKRKLPSPQPDVGSWLRLRVAAVQLNRMGIELPNWGGDRAESIPSPTTAGRKEKSRWFLSRKNEWADLLLQSLCISSSGGVQNKFMVFECTTRTNKSALPIDGLLPTNSQSRIASLYTFSSQQQQLIPLLPETCSAVNPRPLSLILGCCATAVNK